MQQAVKDRYDKFAAEYVTNGENAAKAARDAKYSENGAAQTGHRLLTINYVKNKINELMAVIREELTPEGVKKRFSEQYLLCVVARDRTNAIRILENQGKIVGIYELDNEQKANQINLDKAQTEEAQRIARIINLEETRKGA
jgi:phage terminase small subunit